MKFIASLSLQSVMAVAPVVHRPSHIIFCAQASISFTPEETYSLNIQYSNFSAIQNLLLTYYTCDFN